MSGTNPDLRSGSTSGPPPGPPTVCLGEALIDFICGRPLDDVAQGDAFVPHFGGAAANVAVTALVRTNADEAAVMTGEDDPERAALALLKAGARIVVLTLGPEGAILRGELRLDVPGRPAVVRSAIGAGDVLTGVLLARLATSGFYPAAVAASPCEALAQSALARERWGALE